MRVLVRLNDAYLTRDERVLTEPAPDAVSYRTTLLDFKKSRIGV